MGLTVHNKPIQYLLCTNTGFVQHECRCMQATIQDKLHREDISSIVVNDLCAVPQPFLGLETEYKQTKYFKENLQLLVSC